jgi:AraC family transcriptional regulator
MPPIEPARFADGVPMLLGGVRRTHTFATAARDIPAQWEAFGRMVPLPGQRGGTTYGVICGGSPETRTMEYMCAAEVEALDALPPGGRLRLPAAHYAVFVHRGPIADVGAAWAGAWAWLERSPEWESAQTPDFERYDERYDPAAGELEIWVPVRPHDRRA